MNLLRKLASRTERKPRMPSGPDGMRAYAIGDVHGRLDLLEMLLDRILDDAATRPARRTFVVLLGDLIDRGPSSSGVIECLQGFHPPGIEPVFLMGNHEDVFLNILGGDDSLIEPWLRFGGAECAESYGIDPLRLAAMEPAQAGRTVRAAVPDDHRGFLKGFGDTFRFGDFLFVHAGVRPGVALDRQDPRDLRWVREPFLSDSRDHGFVVVHGHTIVDAPEARDNRIGIDTGAYRSGRLTALRIEGSQHSFMAT